MNIDKLREELAYDEGVVHKVYLDHLGLPTFGIGHLIRESDPEHGAEVGTPISDDSSLPEEAQLIIANMMFNLGYPRLSKFKGMKRGVDARDWNAAADEMVDSRWYRQVTKRADRLVDRMRALA